jgi:hypothetical protein
MNIFWLLTSSDGQFGIERTDGDRRLEEDADYTITAQDGSLKWDAGPLWLAKERLDEYDHPRTPIPGGVCIVNDPFRAEPATWGEIQENLEIRREARLHEQLESQGLKPGTVGYFRAERRARRERERQREEIRERLASDRRRNLRRRAE